MEKHYCNQVADPFTCCPCSDAHGSAPEEFCTCLHPYANFWDAWFSSRRDNPTLHLWLKEVYWAWQEQQREKYHKYLSRIKDTK